MSSHLISVVPSQSWITEKQAGKVSGSYKAGCQQASEKPLLRGERTWRGDSDMGNNLFVHAVNLFFFSWARFFR